MAAKTNLYFSRKPASMYLGRWREGFPAGNGLTGISVFGGAGNETVLLNRGDLWYGLKRGQYPDVSDALPKMRALADQGKYDEANSVLVDAINERGNYSGSGVKDPDGEYAFVKTALKWLKTES